MFDDQPQNPNTAPANLPTEPADMFAGVEEDAGKTTPDALSAGLLKKKDTAPFSETSSDESYDQKSPMDYKVSQPILGKVILFIFLTAVLGGLGYGGWWAYNFIYLGKTNPPPASVSVPVVAMPTSTVEQIPVVVKTPAEVLPTTSVSSAINSEKILFGENIDSDKDGLDDVREKAMGTNINKADSDDDGLTDGDEVVIWKTDPLNPDTDGDGYTDGQEVRNGYSPIGAGKIFGQQAGSVATTTARTTATP